MEHRVFHTADIHINRQIFVCFFLAYQLFIILVIHITQEVPGRTGPLRHGVGLSLRRSAAARTGGVHPFRNVCQRRFSGSGRLIFLYFRKQQRQLFFRYRYSAAFRAVYDRDRLAPVTLTGEYPVTKLIVHFLLTDASLLDHGRRFFFQHSGFHAVPLAGIDHGSHSVSVSLCHVLNLFSVLGDNLNDRNIELLRKLKVTVIMGRHAHDGSCTVICQYIVGQPDWNPGAV